MKRPQLRRPAATLAVLALLVVAPRAIPARQTPAPTDTSSTPTRTQKVADLTGRYRFSERYTTKDDQAGPGLVGPYRVAVIETIKESADSPQGAPKRTESSRHAIFTERPNEMGALGTVASVNRTFEHFQAKPEDTSRRIGGAPLAGLSVQIRPRPGDLPTILGLTEGRSLSEYEFDLAARQIFVAQLSTLLPAQVVRIGDSWRIPRKAIQAILGEPLILEDSLIGKLTEIRKEVEGPRMVAAIAITGKVTGPSGEYSVNGEVLFTFQPESPQKGASAKPSSPTRPAEDLVEARGAITELRMARVASGPLPGPGRLRFQSNRELSMHRQLGILPGVVAPPKLDKAAEPTEANSWLTHVDPLARYAFRHPQDLLAPDRSQTSAEANTSLLVRARREGRDLLQVEFFPKILTPADLKKELAEKYSMMKMEIIQGEEIWLPEAEWPKMRVHRVDVEVKVGDPKAATSRGSTRIHFDGYLIVTSQSSSIMAIATTSRDAVGAYRQEVEKILKTIQLDPPRAIGK